MLKSTIKRSLTITAIACVLNSTTAHAATCEQQLALCDSTVTAGETYIKHLQNKNELLDRKLLTMQTGRDILIEQINAQKPSWYERPSVVAPLAFVLGLLVQKGLSK